MAKKKTRSGKSCSKALTVAKVEDPRPDWLKAGLTVNQASFCAEYASNGFNGTQAWLKVQPGTGVNTAAACSSRLLRSAKIRQFLHAKLHDVWKHYQMGGEEALARIAQLASDDPDSRVRLAALRTVLEMTGKLKDQTASSIDALADAIREDRKRHGFPPMPTE